MKKLFIVGLVILFAFMTIRCKKEVVKTEDERLLEIQAKRLAQMEYVTKLYQYNMTFCRDLKYWEVENQLDSIIILEKKKLPKLEVEK